MRPAILAFVLLMSGLAPGQIKIAFHNGTTTNAAMTSRPAGEVVDTGSEAWNNVVNSGGVGASFSDFALTDVSGADSGARLAANAGYVFYNSNSWNSQSQDWVMMEGWYGFRSSEQISVTNLPAAYAAGFSVIVYGDSNSGSRTMNYTIGGSTKTIQDSGTFTGTMVEGSHCVAFEGLTGTSFTLSGNPLATDTRSAVNGLVIIPGTLPVPPEITSFNTSDAYVTPGSEVTLSWNVTGADSVEITPAPGAVAASGSSSVTVSETTTFTLTATNADGQRTETVKVGVGPARPNLIVFLLDDFGPQDLSVPFAIDGNGQPAAKNFNSFYQTPNMAALAASGMRFTSAYAQSVCSPTRAGMLTGRSSTRHAISDWVGGGGSGSPSNWKTTGLNGSEVTLPKILSTSGYRTMHVGKTHFSNNATPVENLGFDINIAGFHWGHPWQDYIGAPGYGGMPGMSAYDGSLYLTNALTLEANKLLEEAADDGVPFFLNMSYYAVHAPFTTNPDATGDYSAAVSTNHANFATMVEGVDISIGQIRQKLVDLGLAKDTLIVFLGDNGSDSPAVTVDGLPSGSYSDYPLRGKKGSKWEGGSRIPFIATWAESDANNAFQQAIPIPANSVETDIVTSWDVPMTLLDAAGLTPESGFGEDGHSLVGYLAGQPGSHRPQQIAMHYPHAHRSNYFSWVRRENMKLIYNYQNNTRQLYDLAADPTESNDLAAARPEEANAMTRVLARHLADTWGDPGPLIPTIATSAPNGNVVSINSNRNIDSDNDGLSDASEDPDLDGLVEPAETDPDNEDTDGDSTPDGAEVKTGTNPLDPASFFFVSSGLDGENFILTWPSAPGATYRIESSETLAEPWNALEENYAAEATGSETAFDTGPATGAKFFRVGVN